MLLTSVLFAAFEIKEWVCQVILYADLMQQGNFIDVFLVRNVSGTYAHHQEN